jgi:aldehyde dehydrogenase (NAD+)
MMTDLEVTTLLERKRTYFSSGKTRDIDFRIEQLKRLRQALKSSEEKILEALDRDLHKSRYIAFTTEIGVLYSGIAFCLKNIRKWAKPRRVGTPLTLFGTSGAVHPEPYGTVLIIGPFNYPVNLVIEPLIGAIAAGNCAVIKPSELTPHVSAVIAGMVKESFDEDYISVVEGEKETTAVLIKAPFDYIFFTGSAAVGKNVMAGAAGNLVPVTLELGGKSPCIVDETADLSKAAQKIAWGKFSNAGQTCVAPDYLVVHRSVKGELIAQLKKHLTLFYGPEPLQSDDFGRIVSVRQAERLKALIDPARVVIGGQYDIAGRYIAPTVLDGVGWDDRIMEEEIFGPVLPVIEYDDLDRVIERINTLPHPLAVYIFSGNKETAGKIISSMRFGGGCVNDVMLHLANPHLPFGGVGASGMGAYHGKRSFETFSHLKSILTRTLNSSALMMYPPYSEKQLRMVRRFLK